MASEIGGIDVPRFRGRGALRGALNQFALSTASLLLAALLIAGTDPGRAAPATATAAVLGVVLFGVRSNGQPLGVCAARWLARLLRPRVQTVSFRRVR